jgi:membrane protease YdiL (CAAX protease family)
VTNAFGSDSALVAFSWVYFAFGFGVCMSAARIISDSIWLPIALHGVVNLTTVFSPMEEAVLSPADFRFGSIAGTIFLIAGVVTLRRAKARGTV